MTSCWLVKPKVSNVGKGTEHKNNENNEQKYGDKKNNYTKTKNTQVQQLRLEFSAQSYREVNTMLVSKNRKEKNVFLLSANMTSSVLSLKRLCSLKRLRSLRPVGLKIPGQMKS